MFKLDLKKAEEPEIKLPTSTESLKKKRIPKNIYFSFIDYAKLLTVWTTTDYGNASRDGNTTTPYLPPEKSVCRSRSNS